MVTVCGVFWTEKDDGVRLKPGGTPDEVTETAPLNPFCGVIDTCIVDEVPGAIEGEDGATTMVNDGDGGGGGGPDELDEPPPHAANTTSVERTQTVAEIGKRSKFHSPSNIHAARCQLNLPVRRLVVEKVGLDRGSHGPPSMSTLNDRRMTHAQPLLPDSRWQTGCSNLEILRFGPVEGEALPSH
jgi:hypothetical protein